MYGKSRCLISSVSKADVFFIWECSNKPLCSVVLLLVLYYYHTRTCKVFLHLEYWFFLVGFRSLLWLLNHYIFLRSAVIEYFTHIEMFGVFQFASSVMEVIGKFKLCTVISRYDLHVKQGMRHRSLPVPFYHAGSPK